MLCRAMLNEDCLHLYDTAESAKFLMQKVHNKLWPPKVTLGRGGAYEDNMIKLKKSRMKYLIVQYYVTEETCGNKMPTRCNTGFYCRSYCLLNMFQASLCPSSGAQEY